jgi:hypothetical protein
LIVKVPKEKGGEEENIHELRVKRKRKFRVNEGSNIAQSSSRKTRITPEKQVLVPTSNSPSRKTRSAKTEQILVSPPNPSRGKVKKAQDKQISVPSFEPKTKRRRLFKEEVHVPVSITDEVLGIG